MSVLPPLSKTYSSRGNLPFGSVASVLELGRSQAFNLIEHLRDTAAGGATSGTRNANSVWTYKGSSNGSTFNVGGSDLIAAQSDLNWAFGARSWWWGENTTLGYQIVIDCYGSTADLANIIVCPIATPFAGTPSTSVRPVNLTDEFCWNTTNTGNNSITFQPDATTGGSNFTHFCTSTDGQFLFFATRAGTGRANVFVALIKTTGVVTARNVFLVGHATVSGRGAPVLSSLANVATGCVGRNANGVAIQTTGGMVGPRAGGSDVYGDGKQITDGVSGLRNLRACSVVGTATGGVGAERGVLPDFYWCPPDTIGTSIPSAAAQTRTIVGDLLVPFPGVVITT